MSNGEAAERSFEDLRRELAQQSAQAVTEALLTRTSSRGTAPPEIGIRSLPPRRAR